MSSDSDDSSSDMSSPQARPNADELGLDVSDDSDRDSPPPKRTVTRQDSDSDASSHHAERSDDEDGGAVQQHRRALDSDEDEDMTVRKKPVRRARVASSSSSGSSQPRRNEEDEEEEPVVRRHSSGHDEGDSSEAEKESPKRRDEPAEERSEKSASDDERRSEGSHERRDDNEDEQRNVLEEDIPETRIDIDLPRIDVDFGTETHFVKLPNFLSVETRPFDEQQFEDEAPQDDVMDEEGRVRLKLKVENTIRWRVGTDEHGNEVRESNARVVRWSDGSMSLHLGDEVFDVHVMPLHDDFNHLFLKQGNGLEGLTVFRTKLTFRPHSTDSQTHKKVTLSMADRTARDMQKVKLIPIVQGNPELAKLQLAKKEDEQTRAQLKRENRQRVLRMRQRRSGLTQSLLEGDGEEEDGAVSINAMKRDARARKSALLSTSQRASRFSSDDEEAHSGYSDEDSDFDVGKKRKKRTKMVLDEPDDDDDA